MRSTTSICISVRVAALQICDGFVQARIKALPNTADALDATAPQDFLDATAQEIRVAIGATSQEPVTLDQYINIARGVEKQRWMLLAHMPRQESNGRGH